MVGGAVLLAAVLGTLVLSFRMGGEARVVREAVVRADASGWERRIELGLGRVPVALVRGVAGWFPLPPEARAGLEAIQWGDVGVYRRRSGEGRADGAGLIRGATRAMAQRGWEAAVTVHEPGRTVLVFVPGKAERGWGLRACVVVLCGEDLVVASGRVDGAPLMPLLELPWEPGVGWKLDGAGGLGRMAGL